MNLKNYPPALLNNIQKTFEQIREEVSKNEDVIRIVKDEGLELGVEDLDFNSNFFFTISNPQFNNGRFQYSVKYKPESDISLNTKSSPLFSKGQHINEVFNYWIKIVKSYDSFNIHPGNNVFKEYRNKFFEAFKFIDEDNNDKPLDDDKQKLLSQFITSTISVLEQTDDNEDIIQPLLELQKQIPQLTIKQIKHKITWVFAKMKYKGIDVINWLVQNGVKVGYGQLLIEGLKSL